jgi:hypothetical protein
LMLERVERNKQAVMRAAAVDELRDATARSAIHPRMHPPAGNDRADCKEAAGAAAAAAGIPVKPQCGNLVLGAHLLHAELHLVASHGAYVCQRCDAFHQAEASRHAPATRIMNAAQNIPAAAVGYLYLVAIFFSTMGTHAVTLRVCAAQALKERSFTNVRLHCRYQLALHLGCIAKNSGGRGAWRVMSAGAG